MRYVAGGFAALVLLGWIVGPTLEHNKPRPQFAASHTACTFKLSDNFDVYDATVQEYVRQMRKSCRDGITLIFPNGKRHVSKE